MDSRVLWYFELGTVYSLLIYFRDRAILVSASILFALLASAAVVIAWGAVPRDLFDQKSSPIYVRVATSPHLLPIKSVAFYLLLSNIEIAEAFLKEHVQIYAHAVGLITILLSVYGLVRITVVASRWVAHGSPDGSLSLPRKAAILLFSVGAFSGTAVLLWNDFEMIRSLDPALAFFIGKRLYVSATLALLMTILALVIFVAILERPVMSEPAFVTLVANIGFNIYIRLESELDAQSTEMVTVFFLTLALAGSVGFGGRYKVRVPVEEFLREEHEKGWLDLSKKEWRSLYFYVQSMITTAVASAVLIGGSSMEFLEGIPHWYYLAISGICLATYTVYTLIIDFSQTPGYAQF